MIDLSGFWARLVVQNRHQKEMWNSDEIRLCAQNVEHILGSIGNTAGTQGSFQSLKRERDSSL
jgi:hypothetical protein